jgi:hypothetical protein
LLPFVLIEVPLSCCFLIVSVCNWDEVEFKLFRHMKTCSYETKFCSLDKEIKWINNDDIIT